MYAGDLIRAEEACNLLGISRPTFKKYRNEYSIAQYKIGKMLKFSKTELLYKLYTSLHPKKALISYNMYSLKDGFKYLQIDNFTYDLRILDNPDGHAVISLICHLMAEIENGNYIHLLIDKENVFLKAMNFFGVLKIQLNSKIFWDEKTYESIKQIEFSDMIKLPIKRLGVVGSHNTIADDLVLNLSRQGYSPDICSYIGWAIGELADNSSTHAKKYPSFVYFEQFGDNRRFLQFTIGDIGIGIPTSLKKNEKYVRLEDSKALLISFMPNVSGRDESEKRGKGLTDVLKIAMECGSSLRVESNNIGYLLMFNSGRDDFTQVTPLYKNSGTIISIMFIDGNFASLEREDVKNYIESCLKRAV